jgi:hypothetical protein
MFKNYRNKRKLFYKKSKYSKLRKDDGNRGAAEIHRQQSLISDSEFIVVDDKTGGRKGSKESQIGFIDPVALYELGKVAGMGIRKYEKYNYLKGYDWSLSYNACMRHLQQMWAGEDFDEESGLLHVVHAAWHALALASFTVRDLGTDDRFKASE